MYCELLIWNETHLNPLHKFHRRTIDHRWLVLPILCGSCRHAIVLGIHRDAHHR